MRFADSYGIRREVRVGGVFGRSGVIRETAALEVLLALNRRLEAPSGHIHIMAAAVADPLSASQKYSWPSSAALQISLPSGRNATQRTSELCTEVKFQEYLSCRT